MDNLLIVLPMLVLAAFAMQAHGAASSKTASVHDFKVDDISGQPVDLSRYKGKVLLIVNVASRCGHTPQYAALQKLHETYKDKGLAILAFPANEFKAQEPGSNAEIRQFCTSKYGVTFDLFSKIVAKGEGQAPLYEYLTDQEKTGEFGGEIKWNFTKFLVNREGKVVNRFEPKIKPDDEQVVKAVEAELGKK